ncbi:MAG: Ig-like domain-containing protein [SAR324 cluster bacterium]|nr:Ig-like domain-containing protein [SAR324 cluster bacterium]
MQASFSAEPDPASVQPGSINLTLGNTFLQGMLQTVGKTIRFHPTERLNHGSTYDWTVAGSIQDRSGRMLDRPERMSFTTVMYPDLTPPQITGVTPVDNASGVATDIRIEVQFSEPLLEETLTVSNFSLLEGSGRNILGRRIHGALHSGSTTDSLPGLPHLHWNRHHRPELECPGFPLSVFVSDAGERRHQPRGWRGMILLSGGTFQMDAVNKSEEDPDTNSNEFPVHSVTQTGPFLTGKHEVTALQFKACVDAGGCSYSYTTSSDKWTYNQPGKENHPINYVSWDESLEYSAGKSAASSRSYWFCTEAEWEYAARTGTTTKWSCGD